MSVPSPELHTAGEEAIDHQGGSLTCTGCGYALTLETSDTLPVCPACDGDEFKRAPLFSVGDTLAGVPVEPAEEEPKAFADLRARLQAGTFHLAWEDDGEVECRQLQIGWSRVGRSGSADIRFDDPTVSRRHALVVLTSQGELRGLDDRSLNGLYVNGKQVEWSTLADGDELEIGRYRLFVVAGTATG